MALVIPQRRMVAVVWCNPSGKERRKHLPVRFLKGYGHFVLWYGRALLVDDPQQTEIRVHEARGCPA